MPTDQSSSKSTSDMSRARKEVIVRGMKKKWFMDHFKNMKVYFGGDPRAVPKYDADFVGFYLEAPESAITHVGVVEKIERENSGATFFLKAVLKLDQPVEVEHGIRKQEYWTLEELGIQKLAVLLNDFAVVGGEN